MQSAILISIVAVILFIYARIMRDHRIYNRLIVCAALAFVVGSCIKSKSLHAEVTKSEVITTSNPTLHTDSTAFVPQSCESVMSQEKKSDIVIPKTEGLKNLPTDVEIEDDS